MTLKILIVHLPIFFSHLWYIQCMDCTVCVCVCIYIYICVCVLTGLRRREVWPNNEVVDFQASVSKLSNPRLYWLFLCIFPCPFYYSNPRRSHHVSGDRLTHTHIYIYIHTHTHTYIHTHTVQSIHWMYQRWEKNIGRCTINIALIW